MVRKGRGRVFSSGKAKTLFVSIPADVAVDSTFPFDEGEEVSVEIEDGRLVIDERD